MVIREQGGLPPVLPLLFSVTGLRGWLRRCLFTPPVKSPVAFVSPVRPSVRPSGCPFASRPLPFQVRRERRSRILPFRTLAISVIARLATVAALPPPPGGPRAVSLSATRSYGNARWHGRVRLRFLLG